MRILILILVGCFFLTVSVVHSYATDCRASFYDDQALETATNDIAIHATVYVQIVCNNLPHGENTLNINWVNPHNKVYAYDKNTFVVNSPNQWVFVFSFRLMGKGPLQRNFTHTDFSRENYGVWTVNGYLGGERVLSEQFNLH